MQYNPDWDLKISKERYPLDKEFFTESQEIQINDLQLSLTTLKALNLKPTDSLTLSFH